MRTQQPTVGLITIWYQHTRDLARYIAAMEALTYPHIRSVFISQGLPRVDRIRLATMMPNAIILEMGGNVGTAAAWNRGIAALLEDVEYVGIWNADVRPDPRAIEALVDTCETDATIGACQPVLLYSDAPETIQMYGGIVDVRTGKIEHAFSGSHIDHNLPPIHDAGYLDGGTMFLRTSVLREVGAFDERFFMYCEDVDLSLRIQAAGWRTVAVRAARAWHYHRVEKGAFPTPLEAFYDTRNRFYLARKHNGRQAVAILFCRMMISVPHLVAHHVKRGRPRLAWASMNGIVDGVLGRMGKRGWVASTNIQAR